MTPLAFEAHYQDEWSELEVLVAEALEPRWRRRRRSEEHAGDGLRDDRSGEAGSRDGGLTDGGTAPSVRMATLYRRACGHLALARARAYPAHIIDRLERATSDAHQVIYRRHELGWQALARLVRHGFPAAVRANARYVAVSAAVFLIPTLALGLLVYLRSDLILSLVSSARAAEFEDMYSTASDSIGRTRNASTDWMMFGFYIRNNIGIAFQCYAGGLFAGVGSLFFLAFNGAFSGALAGFLSARGLSSTFWPFVATHSAFELTAIVISGAAGLKIGHALLAPGRLARRQALVQAASESVVLVYGVTAMLLVAAAIEAFWSSATWLPAGAKFTAAAVCWTSVIIYFVREGRGADEPHAD